MSVMTSTNGSAPRALLFFPYLPWPIRDGAQRRCTAIVRGFRDLGYDVSLLVSSLVRDEAPSESDLRAAAAALGATIHVHTPELGDYSMMAGIGTAYDTGWEGYTLPSLFERVSRLTAQVSPDVVLINYGYWATLAEAVRPAQAIRLVDMHDLVSLHIGMSRALAPTFGPRPTDPRNVPADAVREDFFRSRAMTVSPHELNGYDLFDGTLAISRQEAALVESHTSRTSVSWVPMAIEPPAIENTYEASPVYVLSDTLLNLQGYAYFAKQVLPRIKARIPDFTLRVVGSGGRAVTPVDGIEVTGPVDALDAVYAGARYAVCPLIGGTGQQVKVVEAMAHGLAVVALDDLAARSPIVDGVNGVSVPDAEAFADACIRLWNEPALARRLGGAARRTVLEGSSQGQLTCALGEAIERARERAAARVRSGSEREHPPRRFLAAAPEAVLDGRRIAIFGAGSLGRRCQDAIRGRSEVVAFVDNDRTKHGTSIEGLPVVGIDGLERLDVDLVMVASMYWAPILNQLGDAGWLGPRVRVF
jgi:hypothetical protein